MDLGLSRLLKGEMTIFIPQVIKQVNWCCIPRNKKRCWLPACILSYQLYSTVALLIGITIESEDTCSDFSPEIQNLSSLVFLSLVIEGTPSGKILLTCHDLLPQSKMHTWKTFFFYIIYDYYHYDIIISDSSSYKSVGIHWTIVFNISI